MTIELSRIGDCALITLRRPEALNALSFDIIRQIDRALDEVSVADGVRALLVTGEGSKAFCAGADIKELRDRTLVEQKRGSELGQAVFAKLNRLHVPSIALVNGYALGGGCELALACTFRIAAPGAVFGLPEIKLGLTPGYGGIARLPRLIGEGRALEIIMTGRNVGAGEAERIGLVNAVAEGDLMKAGIAFAASLTRFSLPVLDIAKQALGRAAEASIDDALRIENDASTLVYQLEDARQGMAAFQEKRKPEFKDR